MPFVRDRAVEQRNVNYGDPNLIPPFPGWMQQAATAGIPVNQSTVRSLEIVQTAIDLITGGIIKRGDPMAYTVELSSNVPYRKWSAVQPPILSDTFLYDGPLTNAQSRGRIETIISMLLFDGAWWQVLGRDGNGDANGVETLFPPLVDIRIENGKKHYFYGLGTDRVELDPKMLVYIPMKSLPGHDRGMSSIRDATPIFGMMLAAMKFGQTWFAQGSHTSMMLSAKGELTEPGAKRIAAQFAARHQGVQNAHVPLIVDQDMTATPMSANPEDSQMTATLNYARQAIASMFHIPFFMVDPLKGAPFADYEDVAMLMEDTLYTNYVVPLEEATGQLLRPGLSAAFATDLSRPNSYNQAAKIMAVKGSDSMTPNEIRTILLGLPPLDNTIADQIGNPSPYNIGKGEGQAQLPPPQQRPTDDEQ